jgi:hypothetical protein
MFVDPKPPNDFSCLSGVSRQSTQRLACITDQFNVAVHPGESDVTTKLGSSLPPWASNFLSVRLYV